MNVGDRDRIQRPSIRRNFAADASGPDRRIATEALVGVGLTLADARSLRHPIARTIADELSTSSRPAGTRVMRAPCGEQPRPRQNPVRTCFEKQEPIDVVWSVVLCAPEIVAKSTTTESN
jgi:hypothetical protein